MADGGEEEGGTGGDERSGEGRRRGAGGGHGAGRRGLLGGDDGEGGDQQDGDDGQGLGCDGGGGHCFGWWQRLATYEEVLPVAAARARIREEKIFVGGGERCRGWRGIYRAESRVSGFGADGLTAGQPMGA